MEIKYVKPLKDKKLISEFFHDLNIQMPEQFEGFFEKYNGGRPMDNECTLKNGEEKVVNSFLSFNEEDKDNIYKARRRVSEDNPELIPFANDPSGNYYCLKAGKIIFYFHEDGEEMEVADSFEKFLFHLQ